MSMEHWWYTIEREKPKGSEEKLTHFSFTTNTARTDLEFIPGLCDERLATNGLCN
jgi:hypothetical protein